MQRFIYLI